MSDEMKNSLQNAIEDVRIHRAGIDGSFTLADDKVASEHAVTIMIDKVGSYTVMCTPCEIKALAVGFIFAEGLITCRQDIVSINIKDTLPDVVGIVVDDPGRVAIQRNLIVASSCGMCGSRNIDKMIETMPPVDNTLTVTPAGLIAMTEKLRDSQQLFKVTGGSHAAGLFDADGRIFAFGEDIGRHSALDKAIGKSILNSMPTRGSGAVLSGRVSLEMVSKAAKAQIELIAAVSAPSSLAVKVAEKWNITLCGFVRGKGLNIYTHPERVIGKD